ncbi:restriction endonuclease subunit S [Mammaliicoccus sciuri]|uniref:restriction endonuclease subunit S n=1 Tax=Mammaliicoccus sciuri TaxID=1296 RepID=UPI001E583112|nr:restriction endonuclease subunit S [Mammaliicoccus sciuri]MCD8819488.1 restriction endonuclease subunit S [Mammaliicoccus sciuri]
MTNELRNVPDLRFPGFEGEWEESNIDNEFDFFNNKRKPIKENLRNKGEYPYYGATGIIDYVDDFIFDGNFILIGEDGANIVSRSAPLVYFATGKFWVNNHAHILYPKFGDIYFNYLLLENIDYEKYNTGTAQPKLNVQNLKKIKIKSPRDNSEQQKIGKFFSKLDRQIELEEQKLAKLEEQKKGYMQKLFSQELRFKDDKRNEYPEWEEKKLGDILERGNKDKVNEIGKYRRLTISLHGKGLYEVKQERKTKDTRPFYQRFEGELIIGKQNFFNGSIAIVTSEFNGFICSNAIMSYKISNHMNRKYLLEYLLQNDFLRKNEYLADGTGQKELSEKKFEELEIKLPNSINEQQKIGVFLERLDNLIEKQSNKLELLKKRKQGFLQKMFV